MDGKPLGLKKDQGRQENHASPDHGTSRHISVSFWDQVTEGYAPLRDEKYLRGYLPASHFSMASGFSKPMRRGRISWPFASMSITVG